MLLKSNLKPILSEPPRPHRFYHSHRHNCTTCSHSVESTTFYSNHTRNNHYIQGHITCNTSNVIYIITCTKCTKTMYRCYVTTGVRIVPGFFFLLFKLLLPHRVNSVSFSCFILLRLCRKLACNYISYDSLTF